MIISIIVAADENNVIGKDNALIWHLPADMKFFKEKTVGHHVLMGRKNYESIPEKWRPLLNRENIVVSRQERQNEDHVHYVNSIGEGIELARGNGEEELFIIGGGEIYRQLMELAHRIYLTRIHHSFEGDTFFPEVDLSKFKMESQEFRAADENNAYDMTYFAYTKK